jgi:hypothetical protein
MYGRVAPQRQRISRRDTPANAAQSANVAQTGQIDAHLAEYEALRNEIEWLIRDASQYQTYALGLIAILPPAFALLVDTRQSWLLVPSLLLASAAFALFGYLFFRNHQEVYVIAGYLARVVRPQVRALTGSTTLWGWEEYKASTYAALRGSSRLGGLAGLPFVVMLRLLVFLLPAGAGPAAAVVILTRGGLAESAATYTWVGLALLGVIALVELLVLVVLSGWCWIKRDLERTLGPDDQADAATQLEAGPPGGTQ